MPPGWATKQITECQLRYSAEQTESSVGLLSSWTTEQRGRLGIVSPKSQVASRGKFNTLDMRVHFVSTYILHCRKRLEAHSASSRNKRPGGANHAHSHSMIADIGLPKMLAMLPPSLHDLVTHHCSCPHSRHTPPAPTLKARMDLIATAMLQTPM